MVYFIPDSKYFKEEEFVDRETYAALKKRGISIWSLFDPRLLYCVNEMRKLFNVPFTINNWHAGRDREWSGYRIPKSPYYSPYSQHSAGRALDIITTDKVITPAYMRKEIISNPNSNAWKYITAVEISANGKPPSWLHMDTRNWNKEKNGIQQVHG